MLEFRPEVAPLKQAWHDYYDEGVPPSLEYPETTVYGLFELSVARSPRRSATLFYGARLSFRKLAQKVDRLAAALASLGVKRGDRVALILPNIPLYPIAHLAVMKLGGILVPTNPLYVERELEYQLNDSGAETAIVLDQLYPRVEKVRKRTSLQRVVLAGVADFLPRILSILYKIKNKSTVKSDASRDVFLYRDLVRSRYAAVETAPLTPDDVAILLYTGGTTGISKGAVLSHRNLVVNVIQTRTWLKGFRDRSETILAVLPFFHSYGMTTALHLAFQSSATLLMLPRFDLKEALKRIKKHRPTIFCGVPSMYNAINHSPGIRSEDVNSIRLCVSGGAALPGDVQKRFEELTGGKLVEGFGLSETSPVAIVNPVFGHRKLATIGTPVSDTVARIVDPETRDDIPVGEVGELVLKGPQVMREYWNMPEETHKALADGWLYTGDLARRDEEGFFQIVDRKKDIIVSAGFNVYPREIEELLCEHPKIVEAAVVGVPSRVREEVAKAFIVLKEGEGMEKSEVLLYLRDHLSKFKIPKQVEFRQELPKSAVGKILKRILVDEEQRRFEESAAKREARRGSKK